MCCRCIHILRKDIHYHIETCMDTEECSLYSFSCTLHGKIDHIVRTISSNRQAFLGAVQHRYRNCIRYQNLLGIPQSGLSGQRIHWSLCSSFRRPSSPYLYSNTVLISICIETRASFNTVGTTWTVISLTGIRDFFIIFERIGR